jgi:hypothetical protein
MADIKFDQQKEKAAASSEQSLIEGEKLKQSLERLGESTERRSFEQVKKEVAEEIIRTEKRVPATIGPVAAVLAPQAKQQKQIEKVMAEGLEEIYLSLAPEKQREFKRVGEETAAKINKLLAKTKVNISEIIKLIKKWLALIPGVNTYFLEKEAKIKADEIIKMRQEIK